MLEIINENKNKSYANQNLYYPQIISSDGVIK